MTTLIPTSHNGVTKFEAHYKAASISGASCTVAVTKGYLSSTITEPLLDDAIVAAMAAFRDSLNASFPSETWDFQGGINLELSNFIPANIIP